MPRSNGSGVSSPCTHPRTTKNPLMDKGFLGSASRTRTCNPAVTAYPQLSLRSGLSHHPFARAVISYSKWMPGADGAYRRESSSPSLCTFPATTAFSLRGFAQGCRVPRMWKVGSPEFTRFFTPGYPRELLVTPTAACSTIELSRNATTATPRLNYTKRRRENQRTLFWRRKRRASSPETSDIGTPRSSSITRR